MNGEEFYKSLLQNIYEGVYFVDKDRRITFWNKGAERITGFTSSEVLNNFCYNHILNHVNDEGEELCLTGCPLHKTMEDGQMREASVYLHHKQGHRIPVSIRTIAIIDNGKTVGAIEVFRDETEQQGIIKEIEKLKDLALNDPLTNLPNRRYIESFLRSKMNEYFTLGIPFGVAFMDIDKFKDFNDNYGHDVGDEVLKMVAKTFRGVVRSNDLIGRWGGEEFLAAFSGVDLDDLCNVSEKLRALIERASLKKGEESLKVTISIGSTLFQPEDTIDTVINRADALLYRSKSEGRNKVTCE